MAESTATAEIESFDTWEPIKYKKPIYPTYSRGKVGRSLYCNNKFHCYGVVHSKPTYDLTPYRPTGFGYAERNRKYIPLSHVQDRSNPAVRENILSRKSKMMRIYEDAIDEIKERQQQRCDIRRTKERTDDEIRKITGNYRNLVTKLRYESKNLINDTDEMIGDVKYRTHQINRILREYNNPMTK
jgi:hypothetical protein